MMKKTLLDFKIVFDNEYRFETMFQALNQKVSSSCAMRAKFTKEIHVSDVRTVLFWVILVKDQTELVRNPHSR